MSEEKGIVTNKVMFFLLGVAVGAIAVALLTPKTGAELRADLKETALALKDGFEELKDLV
jgi:gas vesicle protein